MSCQLTIALVGTYEVSVLYGVQYENYVSWPVVTLRYRYPFGLCFEGGLRLASWASLRHLLLMLMLVPKLELGHLVGGADGKTFPKRFPKVLQKSLVFRDLRFQW